MIAVKAVYEDGALRFLEPLPPIERSPVLLVFLDAPSADIVSDAADKTALAQDELPDEADAAALRSIHEAVSSYRATTKPNYLPDEAHEATERPQFRQAERDKIAQETAAYQVMHADLVKDYLGQYVAIHNGKLVDHDVEFPALHQRIRQRFRRQAVLLRRVELEPERDLVFRSPRFDDGER